jgi:hypothetical protein
MVIGKRGQAAMEFLMTYGWAILVVLIVIGALTYFEILNPTMFLPERCNLGELGCTQSQVTEEEAKFEVQNTLGETITIDSLKVTDQEGIERCSNNELDTTVLPGAKTILSANCSFSSAGGSKEKLNVQVTYYSGGSSTFSHTASGDIISTVESPAIESTPTEPWVFQDPRESSDLIAYWKFDGDLLDSMGGNYVTTVTGAVVPVPGVINQAYYFNGTSYVTFQNIIQKLDINQPWTIAGFAKLDSTKRYALVISFYDNTGTLHDVGIGTNYSLNPNIPVVKISSNGETPNQGSGNINLGQWHHYALVWDGNVFSAYFDGNYDYSDAPTGSLWRQAKSLRAGAQHRPGDENWNGSIDEIMVWNRSLLSKEIYGLYQVLNGVPITDETIWPEEVNTTPMAIDLTSAVGYWKLDGDAIDSSGNNYDGTIINSPTLLNEADCKVGKCYYFDGVDDYIQIPHNPDFVTNQGFTYAAWIKPTAYPNFKTGILSHNFPTMGINKYKVAYVRLNPNIDSKSVNGTTELELNKWYHIVTMEDINKMTRVYVNGVLEADIVRDSFNTNTYPVKIGAGGASIDYFNGTIDEVKIWNRALTSQEVTDLYASYP